MTNVIKPSCGARFASTLSSSYKFACNSYKGTLISSGIAYAAFGVNPLCGAVAFCALKGLATSQCLKGAKDHVFLGAVKTGVFRQIQVALLAGGNINARNKKGKTALHFCFSRGEVNEDHLSIAEELLRRGINIHAKDAQNKTGLDYLIEVISRNAFNPELKPLLTDLAKGLVERGCSFQNVFDYSNAVFRNLRDTDLKDFLLRAAAKRQGMFNLIDVLENGSSDPCLTAFLDAIAIMKGNSLGQKMLSDLIHLVRQSGFPVFLKIDHSGNSVFNAFRPDFDRNRYLVLNVNSRDQGRQFISCSRDTNFLNPHPLDCILYHEFEHMRYFLSHPEDPSRWMMQSTKDGRWTNREERRTILRTNPYHESRSVHIRIFHKCPQFGDAAQFLKTYNPKSDKNKEIIKRELVAYMSLGLCKEVQILCKRMDQKSVLEVFDIMEKEGIKIEGFSLEPERSS